MEQRTASEVLKIESRSRRIAKDPSGQAIIDAATAFEVA
jgi:hypothetical protein